MAEALRRWLIGLIRDSTNVVFNIAATEAIIRYADLFREILTLEYFIHWLTPEAIEKYKRYWPPLRYVDLYVYGLSKDLGLKYEDKRVKEALRRAVVFVELIKYLNYRGAVDAARIAYVSREAAIAWSRLWASYVWSVGIGWLSWMTISPILDVVLVRPLRRILQYYKRTREISESDFEDAVVYGFKGLKEYIEYLRYRGIPEDQIDAIKRLLVKKLLSPSTIKMIKYGVIKKEHVEKLLKDLGYEINLDELVFKEDYRELTTSVIKYLYFVGLWNATQVQSALEKLGYSKDAIKWMFISWYFERRARVGEARARRMFLHGVISEEDYKAYLRWLGWHEDDIILWVATVKKIKEEEKDREEYYRWRRKRTIALARARGLTRTDLDTLWRYGIIDDRTYINLARKLLYPEENVKIHLSALKARRVYHYIQRLERTVYYLYRDGYLSAETAKEILSLLGYHPDEADMILKIAELEATIWSRLREEFGKHIGEEVRQES